MTDEAISLSVKKKLRLLLHWSPMDISINRTIKRKIGIPNDKSYVIHTSLIQIQTK